MAKKTDFTYDRSAKRWRKGGKWSKAPKRSQLRSDALGRPIDAAGKRAPLGSFVVSGAPKAPKKKQTKREQAKPRAGKPAQTKPKARKKRISSKGADKRGRKRQKGRAKTPKTRPKRPLPREKRVRFLPATAPVRYVPEGKAVTVHELLSSTFQNKRPPEKAGDVLFNLLGEKAKKTFLDPDDIVMYKFGVQYINMYGRTPMRDMDKLIGFFRSEFPDFEIVYNEDSVHVLLGSEDSPMLREEAAQVLRQKSKDLAEIYNYLDDLWDGDIGWFVIAENDEVEGGS